VISLTEQDPKKSLVLDEISKASSTLDSYFRNRELLHISPDSFPSPSTETKMNDLPSAVSSSEAVRAAEERQMPGNLALCQTSEDGSATSCLGWIDIERPLDDIMKPRLDAGSDSDGVLNWRYENGLLRSVDPDGQATGHCLGPANGLTSLDGATCKPTELVRRNCPDIARENIFSHNTFNTDPVKARTTVNTAVTNARHMQFLVLGDGRVQSLAPVVGKEETDIIAEKPFCVTVAKMEDDIKRKAYLMPCFGEELYNKVQNKDALRITPDQQVFDKDSESSFEPFLFHWKSEDESMLQLAYQIGYNGSYSPSEDINWDRFDSFAIRVTKDADPLLDEHPALVLETPVSWGSHQHSGILSYALSDLDDYGGMEAHLIGLSRAGIESRWLASTSFVVPESALEKSFDFPNSWTWALVTFWGIMIVYVIVVKAKDLRCTDRGKRKKRESDLTADTLNSISVDDDWGRTSVQVPTRSNGERRTSLQMPIRIDEQQINASLFRITEEEEEEEERLGHLTSSDFMIETSGAETEATEASEGSDNDIEAPQQRRR
jgi:hypothetical protein